MNFISVFYFIVLFIILIYYVMSLRFSRFLAAYIAGLSHLALGFLALPSIGLFIIGLGIIEIVLTFLLSRSKTKK